MVRSPPEENMPCAQWSSDQNNSASDGQAETRLVSVDYNDDDKSLLVQDVVNVK